MSRPLVALMLLAVRHPRLTALACLVLWVALRWHATVMGASVPVVPVTIGALDAAALGVVAFGIARSLGWRPAWLAVIEWR